MSAIPNRPRGRYDPSPYACETCGASHEIPGYALSHWFSVVLHTCNACLALHELHRGIAKMKIKGKIKQ